MGSQSFEKLRVYRLAEELADTVWDAVKGWNILASDTIGKQIIRDFSLNATGC